MLISSLFKILNKTEYAKNYTDREISRITNDSREANENHIFVCIKGFYLDGHSFAKKAYENGCRVFVAEDKLSLPDDACVVTVEDSRRALALLSCELYGNPSSKLFVIGITGTKGKTTTALIIKQLLDASGIPTGYIGSNGVLYGGKRLETSNTTPESHILQSHLKNMLDSGIKAAVIEVSSQALYLNRVLGISFDLTVFTNLSLDHVGKNEHPTFEDYFNAKKTLFDKYPCKLVIANADDPYTNGILADCNSKKVFYSTGSDSDIKAENIEFYKTDSILGMSFDCHIKGECLPCKLSIPGEFNVHNALAAVAVANYLGISGKNITDLLSQIKIEGRFDTLSSPEGACFVIDYAHNGLSLKSALVALRKYEPSRLICLFGSVGGRTQIRRVQLGAAASKYADLSILTSDNPDREDPQNIINEISYQYNDPDTFISIPDRQKAIEYAVSIAHKGDIVLLAGKGHERYQLINGKKEYFCEREIIENCINSIKLKR